LRARDVAFGSDVHCVSDVTSDGVAGKHHITLRRRRNFQVVILIDAKRQKHRVGGI